MPGLCRPSDGSRDRQPWRCWSTAIGGGCRRTRRSTSGGVIRIGHHVRMHWGKTQTVVALSSGEAELNAVLKGASEGMGITTMLTQCGEKFNLQVKTDSSACVGTSHRLGLGRLKHSEVKKVWIQEAVKSGSLAVNKLPRMLNCSDVLTHHWNKADGERHLAELGEWRHLDT